jgi:O-succinylbenzoate synthase
VDIERVTLRFVKAVLTRPFENRWQRYLTWTKLTVEVAGGGAVGHSECAAMETPFYNYETIETAWHICERYLVPILLRTQSVDPAEAQRAWADINGHEEAKAGVEGALWDLRARQAGRPLCEELGGSVRPVPAGTTTGIEPTVDQLLANLAQLRDEGFPRIRIKIRPGWDAVPLLEIQRAFPDLPIIADANGAYGEEHVDHLVGLDEFGLMALEQPFPRHLVECSVALQRRIDTAVCLDEQIHSARELRQAWRTGAGRMVNLKIGRVGGLTETSQIAEFCLAEGIELFIGSKWDQGLGRWGGLAAATLPAVTLPSDVGPSRSYYPDDGVDRALEFCKPGWVMPTAEPGLGVVPTTDGVEIVRSLELTPKDVK